MGGRRKWRGRTAPLRSWLRTAPRALASGCDGCGSVVGQALVCRPCGTSARPHSWSWLGTEPRASASGSAVLSEGPGPLPHGRGSERSRRVASGCGSVVGPTPSRSWPGTGPRALASGHRFLIGRTAFAPGTPGSGSHRATGSAFFRPNGSSTESKSRRNGCAGGAALRS